MDLERLASSASTSVHPRGGLALTFDSSDESSNQRSESWSVAGWTICLVYLTPHQQLCLPSGNHYAKVITGRLANIDRTCFTDDFAVRSTALTDDQLTTADNPCLFALFTLEQSATIENMNQCVFRGPEAQHLSWQTFHEKYGEFTDAFRDLDCHIANGIHVMTEAGEEIVYINFWTCGKGTDLTTHNHGQPPSEAAPAFAEVHWVLQNGTGSGGMYETSQPGAEDRVYHPMQFGEEHGPYFEHHAGHPVLLDSGAVKYPWHGWQGGEDGLSGQSYDFVAAFEISPKYALIF